MVVVLLSKVFWWQPFPSCLATVSGTSPTSHLDGAVEFMRLARLDDVFRPIPCVFSWVGPLYYLDLTSPPFRNFGCVVLIKQMPRDRHTYRVQGMKSQTSQNEKSNNQIKRLDT
jgi:hypothetical protein